MTVADEGWLSPEVLVQVMVYFWFEVRFDLVKPVELLTGRLVSDQSTEDVQESALVEVQVRTVEPLYATEDDDLPSARIVTVGRGSGVMLSVTVLDTVVSPKTIVLFPKAPIIASMTTEVMRIFLEKVMI